MSYVDSLPSLRYNKVTFITNIVKIAWKVGKYVLKPKESSSERNHFTQLGSAPQDLHSYHIEIDQKFFLFNDTTILVGGIEILQ